MGKNTGVCINTIFVLVNLRAVLQKLEKWHDREKIKDYKEDVIIGEGFTPIKVDFFSFF